MENPFNILWNKEISYRFENILQSQEFMDQFDNFLSKNIGVSQNEIDNATKELTKSSKISAHPKRHDILCADAHCKVIATARLLKGNPFLINKLKSETKQYNKLVRSKHKQFIDNMFDERDTMQLIKSMREGNVSPSDW